MIAKLDDYGHRGLLTKRIHPTKPLYLYNYTRLVQYDSLWDEVTLQCRGLIVDHEGDIIARPFSKFFNVGEPDCPPLPDEPFDVYEKMDGSLIIAALYEGELVVATRGSFESEQAEKARQFFQAKYAEHTYQFEEGITYLFEIIYPSNRIVVDYGDREDLVFLGARHTETGHDLDIELEGFPRAKKVIEGATLDTLTPDELKAHALPGEEGYVLRFESGFRAKVKFDEYVRLHRIVTGTTARTVWEWLRNGESIETLLEHTPDEFDEWVRRTSETLTSDFNALVDTYTAKADELAVGSPLERPEDRKVTALAYQASGLNTGILFCALMGNEEKLKDWAWRQIKPEHEKAFFAEEIC